MILNGMCFAYYPICVLGQYLCGMMHVQMQSCMYCSALQSQPASGMQKSLASSIATCTKEFDVCLYGVYRTAVLISVKEV